MKINNGSTASAGHRPGGLELTRYGLSWCRFPPGGPIVDVGCGAGATVRLLRGLGYEALGLDPDPPVKDAKIPIIRARAEALPFAEESLSGLICECVLSLCEGYAQTLKGFWEACRPGAFLLLTDLYERSAVRPEGSPGTREELESALCETGWRVERFEDHSRALREYAAQLIWRGEESLARTAPKKTWGYGLWIAQKEAL